MASTNFVDKQTQIVAAWANDVNQVTYGPTSPAGTLRADLLNQANASLGSSMIGWFKSLTHFVGRTLSSKLSDQYSVTDYGAVGDGVTDNATFLANCPATDLLVPPGTYLVNSNTTIAANLCFAAGAILKPASGVTITLSNPFTAPLAQIFDQSAGGTAALPSAMTEVYPEWWGAKGDNAADDSAPLQSAVTQGIAGIRLAARIYKFGTGLTQDNSAGGFPGVGALATRLDLRGESMANSILNYSGTNYAITLTGSTSSGTGQGIHALDNYRNFLLQCSTANNANSGMNLTNKAWFKIEDVTFNLLNVALLLTSCYSASIKTCYFNSNTYGAFFNTNALGPSNVIIFDSCIFQSNSYAAFLGSAVGAGVKFVNCSFESNGTQGNANTGGAVLTLSAQYGQVGPIIFENCYFEGNAGGADISVSNASATLTATVVIKNCLFQRISNTGYTTNNINISTAGGPVNVLLEGNSFFSTGTYVPSASRLFWVGAANCNFIDKGGNVFSETTSLPARTSGNWLPAVAFATTQFAGATGAPTANSNCTVSRTGTGAYTITFNTPAPNANYVPIICADRGGNGAIGYAITNKTTTQLAISTTNQAASANDPPSVSVAVFL